MEIVLLFKRVYFFLFALLLVILCTMHLSYSVSTDYDPNDIFLNICNISNDDLENVNFVLKNSNDRYIQSAIEDIENQTLKQAVYLLIFYRHNNGYYLPNGAVEAVGYDTIKQVSSLSVPFLNYLLKQQTHFSGLKEIIELKRLTNIQKKKIIIKSEICMVVLITMCWNMSMIC